MGLGAQGRRRGKSQERHSEGVRLVEGLDGEASAGVEVGLGDGDEFGGTGDLAEGLVEVVVVPAYETVLQFPRNCITLIGVRMEITASAGKHSITDDEIRSSLNTRKS